MKQQAVRRRHTSATFAAVVFRLCTSPARASVPM